MQVVGVNIHPVKSTAVRPVSRAPIGPAGLRGDRRWMIADPTGELVSARELAALLAIVSDTPDTDPDLRTPLRLRARGADDLTLDLPSVEPGRVRVHGHVLPGTPVGAVADAWLQQVTGRDLRLFHSADPTRRTLDPAWARPGDHTAFADSAPITVVSLASMRQLNSWIAETSAERGDPEPAPLPVDRFRANIVIDGDNAPFAEDQWPAIRVGDQLLRRGKETSRCVMTTVDLATFTTSAEPIRTLARHRRWDRKTWFAMRMVPQGIGQIAVGDPVRVESAP